jgi:erythromycin esterase
VTDAPDVLALDATTPEAVQTGLGARADLWAEADVVGVGWTARTVRELHVVAHGLVRLLVEDFGFGSVLIEGDRQASEAIDRFVREGAGDPWATLAEARPFLAIEEMLDLVRWLRQHNRRDSVHRVGLVHGGTDDLSSPAALERSLADPVISWRERFGHRIVYLGGIYHTAVAAQRTASAVPETVPAAGSLLRERFGAGYRSVGLTFGSGAIPQPVPPPAPSSLEARLDALPHSTKLVTTRALRDHPEWIAGADRVRVVGPDYNPAEDSEHAMFGDPTSWFDVVIHHSVTTSVRFLRSPV